MSGQQRSLWPLAALATALGCAGLWFLLHWFSPKPDDEGDAATEPVASNQQKDVAETRLSSPVEETTLPTLVHEGLVMAVPPEAMRTELAAPHHLEPHHVEPPEVAAQSLNVVGPGPYDPHLPGMVPHPLDGERARIATENRLLQAMNDAMSFRKVKEMREMLVDLAAVAPEDVDKHQLGYEVIADCIEFPGDASLTAARAFYDTERHSPLRRFVRRICFENRN